MNEIKYLYVEYLELFLGGLFLEYCTEAKMFAGGDRIYFHLLRLLD
jgi:hypothetical protein